MNYLQIHTCCTHAHISQMAFASSFLWNLLSHRMRYQIDEMHFDREGKRKTSKHKHQHHNKSSALIYLWDIKVMKCILTLSGKEKQVKTNINITINLLLSTANDFNSHSTLQHRVWKWCKLVQANSKHKHQHHNKSSSLYC